MATETKIWRVSATKNLESIPDVSFGTNHLEKDLESWIADDSTILGVDLLVVARQPKIPGAEYRICSVLMAMEDR